MFVKHRSPFMVGTICPECGEWMSLYNWHRSGRQLETDSLIIKKLKTRPGQKTRWNSCLYHLPVCCGWDCQIGDNSSVSSTAVGVECEEIQDETCPLYAELACLKAPREPEITAFCWGKHKNCAESSLRIQLSITGCRRWQTFYFLFHFSFSKWQPLRPLTEWSKPCQTFFF